MLLNAIMAFDLWAHLRRSRHIIFYIDNDGARYSLIKGYSSSLSLSLLSRMLAVRLEELVCIQWFARVASASNLASFPSRGNDQPLPSNIMCDVATTLHTFDRCADEFLLTKLGCWGWVKWPTRPLGLSQMREGQRGIFFLECHPTPT